MDFKKILSIIGFIVLFCIVIMSSSCKSSFVSEKDKEKKDFVEKIITKTTIKGDTVTVPVLNFKVKDSTIITYNKQGTAVHTTYDKDGLVALIECIEQSKEEYREETRRLIEESKKKESETQTRTTVTFEIIIGVIIFIFLYSNYAQKKSFLEAIKSIGQNQAQE